MTERPHEPRLERRPEAAVLQVDDLVADIEAGKIRLPRFQRAFAWKDEDRRKLFDSIYRGYPVGTLLLWRHAAPRDEIDWGGLRIAAEARPDALFVVDGQQRLATLALALLGAEERSGLRPLYFDPEERELRIGTRTRLPPSTWLPVANAGDPSRLVEWLGTAALGRPLETAVKEFAKRVQQARLPAHIVDASDEETVRRLFERINRSGHPLKAPEVFDALHGSFRTERPSSLRDLTQALAVETRFGALDEDSVLGALFAIREGIPHWKLDELATLPTAERDELIDKTLSALRLTIGFLRDDAGIPHRKLVPYASPIPVLARFFHRHPAPHPRSRLLLRRWLYRGATTGTHRSDIAGMRRTLEAVGEREHRSIQLLLAATASPLARTIGPLQPFDSHQAWSRLELLALASLEPRSLETGDPVDLFAVVETSKHGERGLTELPIVLRGLRVKEHKLAGTLANRALHERHRLAQKLAHTTDPEILASHAISPEAHQALVEGDGPRFLQLRAKVLEGVVARFLATRAEFGADDGPPVDALTIEDPDP